MEPNVSGLNLDKVAKGSESASHEMEEPWLADLLAGVPTGLPRDLGLQGGSCVDTVPAARGRLIDGKVERGEKYEIIELMLDTSSEPFLVIPICGEGGVGKTTLADMVYKDERVKDFFDLRVWVYASEDFDVLSLPRSVLHSIVPSRLDGMDLETKLHQTLSNKKFLIVLDGVGNLKCDDLDHIYHLFRTGVSGSKLIVTTRDHSLPDTNEVFSVSNLYYDDLLSGRYRIFRLSNLSYDDLWSLLEHHSLDDGFDKHPQLGSIGLE